MPSSRKVVFSKPASAAQQPRRGLSPRCREGEPLAADAGLSRGSRESEEVPEKVSLGPRPGVKDCTRNESGGVWRGRPFTHASGRDARLGTSPERAALFPPRPAGWMESGRGTLSLVVAGVARAHATLGSAGGGGQPGREREAGRPGGRCGDVATAEPTAQPTR